MIKSQRKPQTEQQILARNEGRALGQVGMIQSNLRQLLNLKFITTDNWLRLSREVDCIQQSIYIKQKARMIAAGTYKDSSNG